MYKVTLGDRNGGRLGEKPHIYMNMGDTWLAARAQLAAKYLFDKPASWYKQISMHVSKSRKDRHPTIRHQLNEYADSYCACAHRCEFAARQTLTHSVHMCIGMLGTEHCTCSPAMSSCIPQLPARCHVISVQRSPTEQLETPSLLHSLPPPPGLQQLHGQDNRQCP